ncbi:MAG: hypothetical protein K2X01_03600 [Cyanobacteria bacterium]|nr:hypothetical protein [Cyanobacteriota bacterium]
MFLTKNNQVLSTLFALLMAACVVWGAVLLLPLAYGEPDDPGMVDFLRHSQAVPFMTVMLSRWLISGYQANPNLAWYALYHYCVFTIELGLIYVLIQRILFPLPTDSSPFHRTWRYYLFMALIGLVFLGFVTRLTFTTASILSGGLALIGFSLLLIQEGERHNNDNKQKYLLAIGCGLLLSLCFITRYEGLKAILLFSAFPAYGIYAYFQSTLQSKFVPIVSSVQRLAVFISCLLLPLLVTVTVEKTYFPLSPAEAEFDRYQWVNQNTIGFGISDLQFDNPVFKRIGWSPNDYKMFQHWLFFHEDKYGYNPISELAKATEENIPPRILQMLTPSMLGHSIKETIHRCWLKQYQWSCFLLGLFLLMGLQILGVRQSYQEDPNAKNRMFRSFYTYISLFLYIFSASWAMNTFLRFPIRVSASIYFLFGLGALWVYFVRRKTQGQVFSKFILPWHGHNLGVQLLSLVSIGLILTSVIVTGVKISKIPQKQRDFQANYAYINALTGEGGYLIRESGVFPFTWVSPLTPDPGFKNGRTVGWTIFSALFYERLRSHGITWAKDLMPWMTNRKDCFVLVEPPQTIIIQQFMKETYHKTVQLVPAGELPAKPYFTLYRIVESKQ